MKGLVLSGGGSRGAYQAGVVHGLVDCGWKPDLISGTSVGAVNAAFMASGMPAKDWLPLWESLDTKTVAPRRRDVWNMGEWLGYAHQDKFRGWLEEHLDLDAVRRSGIQLRVTATDLCCGRSLVWDQEEITYDHLLASAAIPGVFEPIEMGGHQLVDGGVLRNTPLRPALKAGCTDITAVVAHPMDHDVMEKAESIREVLVRIADIHTHRSLEEEIALVQAGMPMRIWGLIPRRHKPKFRLISPEHDLGGNLLAFDKEQTQRWYKTGYKDGLRTCKLNLGQVKMGAELLFEEEE